MNIKNIKSFIEFYKFLGITDCISPVQRNKMKVTVNPENNVKKMKESKKTEKIIESKLGAINNLKSLILNLDCNLKDVATNLVLYDGNYDANIMFIGEAPGANEDINGKPFVGDAGKLLDKMLSFINLSRNNIYITNMVFWRPPGNRTPNDKEISICLPYTKKHIKIIKPKLLVFVGSIAAKNLLNSKEGITKIRGKKHIYEDKENDLKIEARAIFHPAYLMRNPIEKKTMWDDLLEIDEFINSNNILQDE